MSRTVTLFSALTLACALVACSKSSAAEKTPEEVRQEAQSMDEAQLEAQIQETKDLIAAKTAEIEKMGTDAIDKGKEALDKGLEGLKGKGQEVVDQNDGALKTLQNELASLQAQLSVYTEELAKKKSQ